jgi:hypothetical protein
MEEDGRLTRTGGAEDKPMSESQELMLMKVMSHHHGRARAISMTALHQAVFGRQVGDKINGTRRLRELVTRLKDDGVPICSKSDSDGGGYYLASAGSDLEDYCRRLRAQALRKLAIEAKLRRMALPELLGQISVALAREERPEAARQK